MKRYTVIIIIVVLAACSKEDFKTGLYFNFDNNAKQWFSDLKINDTLKFMSNHGNKRTYVVTDITTKHEYYQDCSFTTMNCVIYFEYDRRVIFFNRVDSISSPTSITMYMFPIDTAHLKNLPRNAVAKVVITGSFDDYNGQPLPIGRVLLSFPNVYQPVSFSTFVGIGKTYNEVIKFNSNNPNTYHDVGWNKNYSVNEAWYDRKFGFVYFRDLFGQYWERQN